MSQLRELILDAVKAELPDLFRETMVCVESLRAALPQIAADSVRLELQRQTRAVLEREIELIFRHNPDVGRTVREATDHAADSIVERYLVSKLQQNEEVRDKFREFCITLLVEKDGFLSKMLGVVEKTEGVASVELSELTPGERAIYDKGRAFVNLLAEAVVSKLREDLQNDKA